MHKKEIYLILNNIRSAYNAGSIFRTADGAGVSKIYLCGITPCPTIDNRLSTIDKVSKTALGAEKTVPWEYCAKTWQLLRELKIKNPKLKVVGLEQTKDSKNIFDYKPKFPLAILVGNEVKGLSPKILEYVDDIIEIPMYGKKESLNVAVSVGVALYGLINKKPLPGRG